MQLIDTLTQRYDQLVWHCDLQTLPRWQAHLIVTARIVQPVLADLWTGMPALRAMSLVYTTLLSLVPLLAVSFSVLKGFGVHNQIEPMLLNLLAPLGEKSAEITQRIIGFVENMKAGVLGSVGLAMLIYTIISLTQKIERGFNEIWRVSEDRPLSQRFSNYLSVILVGPVLVFSAIGFIATLMNSDIVKQLSAIQPLGTLIDFATHLMPYLLIVAAFSFIYIFVPNTKVKLKSALIGGLVSSILWNASGWVFASFIAGAGNYTAVYSAFASLILFMIWIYLNWLILLVGSSIAFYHQHPEFRYLKSGELQLSHQLRERLVLEIVALIADAFQQGKPAYTLTALSDHFNLPKYAIEWIVLRLKQAGLLGYTAGEPGHLILLHPLENISLTTLIHLIRHAEEDHYLTRNHAISGPVNDIFSHYQQSIEQALDGLNAADLIKKSDTIKQA